MIPRSNLIACIWDFDKTLVPGYMQRPLFKTYGVDEPSFWKEVQALEHVYKQQGIEVTNELLYLNHLLTHVKSGPMHGLNNAKLRELGQELVLFEGLPTFFQTLKQEIENDPQFSLYELKLEHYILSSGLTEMIRGSQIAPYVDGIFACEFIEEPMLPGFLNQPNLPMESESREISQIARIVDDTTKTRFLFEINKGVNKYHHLNVNSVVSAEERRIPMEHMIYIADGPTDVPTFSVIRDRGGKTLAVHQPGNMAEFIQNDTLLQNGRIDYFGPADYRPESLTARWLTMHVRKIAEDIVRSQRAYLQNPDLLQWNSASNSSQSQQIKLFQE